MSIQRGFIWADIARGGTLALLVGAMTKAFRAIIAFGPVHSVAGYGKDVIAFDATQKPEIWLRAPIIWNKDITTPTYVIEGNNEPSNIQSVQKMQSLNKNPQIHFAVIEGATHFSVLRPLTRYIAAKMKGDVASAAGLQLKPEELNAAFEKANEK